MKLDLAGIESYQLELGKECAAFADLRLQPMIKGINRDHREPERRIRKHLTRPPLSPIFCHLSRSNYDAVSTRVAFTLAFVAFLQVGEFT